jgi:GGDEF domain-containing protein
MCTRLTGRPWARVALILLLGGAAYMTNRYPVPLAFGLHMLFGGIFAMLAAILYGPWAGGIAAALSAWPTLQLWGHPFAMLSMTLEGWLVGYEARRGRQHHAETDLAYWLLVGGPLVLLTYSLGADIPLMASGVAALKQAVNGLINTATASVLVLVLVWWQRGRRQVRLEIFLANLIAFLVLAPLAFSLSWITRESGSHLRTQMSGEAVRAGEVVYAGLTRELADQRQASALDMDRLSQRVLALAEPLGVELVVTDQANRVVVSSWQAVTPGSTFVSDPGEAAVFNVADERNSDRRGVGGTSLVQAERVAFIHRIDLPELGWQIYVRKPLGAVEYLLYRSYLNSFVTALAVMLVLLVTIRLMAYTVTRPLVELAGIRVTQEGEMAGLPPTRAIWVTEVRAVAEHLGDVGARIKELIERLHETQRELQRHNVELAVANVHLADEALRDARTGLHNQRVLWQQVQLWVESGHAFTLVLADVIGLPGFAAVRGRLGADEWLKHLALELQPLATMQGGEVYQYGPERFAFLFPESSEWLVERMVRTLPSLVNGLENGREQAPGLAVGAARFPEDGQTGPAVVEVADRRLRACGAPDA